MQEKHTETQMPMPGRSPIHQSRHQRDPCPPQLAGEGPLTFKREDFPGVPDHVVVVATPKAFHFCY